MDFAEGDWIQTCPIASTLRVEFKEPLPYVVERVRNAWAIERGGMLTGCAFHLLKLVHQPNTVLTSAGEFEGVFSSRNKLITQG